MQQVILGVMWRKGFFGESGFSWDTRVSARISVTRSLATVSHNSLSQPVCSGFAKTSPNREIQILEAFEDFLDVY